MGCQERMSRMLALTKINYPRTVEDGKPCEDPWPTTAEISPAADGVGVIDHNWDH